jgi:hypothetical protein
VSVLRTQYSCLCMCLSRSIHAVISGFLTSRSNGTWLFVLHSTPIRGVVRCRGFFGVPVAVIRGDDAIITCWTHKIVVGTLVEDRGSQCRAISCLLLVKIARTCDRQSILLGRRRVSFGNA